MYAFNAFYIEMVVVYAWMYMSVRVGIESGDVRSPTILVWYISSSKHVGMESGDIWSPTIFVWHISLSKRVGIELRDVRSPTIRVFLDIYVHVGVLVLTPEMLNPWAIFCLICALYNIYEFFLLYVVINQS